MVIGNWGSDALTFLKERLLNTCVFIQSEYRDGSTDYVTVLNEAGEAEANLAVDLLSSGLMQVTI